MRMLTAFAALALTATPALAQDAPKDESVTAYKAMSAGNYSAAEERLRETAHTDIGARLNLAQIFADTDREREALVLLRSVLENDEAILESVDGEILSSHTVARYALKRMGVSEQTALAAR